MRDTAAPDRRSHTRAPARASLASCMAPRSKRYAGLLMGYGPGRVSLVTSASHRGPLRLTMGPVNLSPRARAGVLPACRAGNVAPEVWGSLRHEPDVAPLRGGERGGEYAGEICAHCARKPKSAWRRREGEENGEGRVIPAPSACRAVYARSSPAAEAACAVCPAEISPLRVFARKSASRPASRPASAKTAASPCAVATEPAHRLACRGRETARSPLLREGGTVSPRR